MAQIAGGWWRDAQEPFKFRPEANPYVGHRLTIQKDDQVACDCGNTFETATELERHQHPYRNPGTG